MVTVGQSPSEGGPRGLEVTVPLRKPPKYELMLPEIVAMTEAGRNRHDLAGARHLHVERRILRCRQ